MTHPFRRGEPVPLSTLGPLETQVLQALWSLGKGGGGAYARDVLDALKQPLAYTTVTTTLDRLCKKNLLERDKVQRAFVYKPIYTRMQLDEFEAHRVIRSLAGGGQLVSCLIDAVTRQDASLLDELEEKIRRRREDLQGGKA